MSKKVWIWNHYATDMFVNEGGRHYSFAQKIKKHGYEPTVFCANTFHNKLDSIDTGSGKYHVKYAEKVPFVFIKTKPAVGNGIDRLQNMLLFYFNLKSVALKYASENGKPDVILASSVHPLTMVAGIQIAKKLGVPCVCEIRDLWPEAIFQFNKAKEKSLLGRILVTGEHWIYRNADALIFTKEGDVDYIKEHKWDTIQGGDIDLQKAYYINNGIDLKKFDEQIKIYQLDDDDLVSCKFNVTYVGSIRPVNDVDKILDVAKLMIDNTEIQFLIYGDGNQRAKIEKRVINEQITNVKVKGFVNKKYIPYILNNSSINLLNYSSKEYNWTRGNSSNKLFEYLASGKPIIASIKTGYSIIKKYQAGFELESDTPQEYAKTILKIKNMNDIEYKKISERAFLAAKDFDFDKLTVKLVEVLDSVIEQTIK